jgi:hypothetical protein
MEKLYDILLNKVNFPALLSFIMVMIIGIWWCLPPDSFAVSRSWDLLSSVAPDWVWGLGSVAAGATGSYATIERKEHLMQWAALGQFYFWLLTFVSIIVHVFISTLVPITFMLMLYNAWLYVTLKLDRDNDT